MGNHASLEKGRLREAGEEKEDQQGLANGNLRLCVARRYSGALSASKNRLYSRVIASSIVSHHNKVRPGSTTQGPGMRSRSSRRSTSLQAMQMRSPCVYAVLVHGDVMQLLSTRGSDARVETAARCTNGCARVGKLC